MYRFLYCPHFPPVNDAECKLLSPTRMKQRMMAELLTPSDEVNSTLNINKQQIMKEQILTGCQLNAIVNEIDFMRNNTMRTLVLGCWHRYPPTAYTLPTTLLPPLHIVTSHFPQHSPIFTSRTTPPIPNPPATYPKNSQASFRRHAKLSGIYYSILSHLHIYMPNLNFTFL